MLMKLIPVWPASQKELATPALDQGTKVSFF